eukprot:Opistho-2@27804
MDSASCMRHLPSPTSSPHQSCCAWDRDLRWSLGRSFYGLFIASFIHVIEPVFYVASVLIGFGASVLWTAQGTLIAACSDEETRGRNSGLFWALFQFSVFIGSIIAYFIVPSDNSIPTSTVRTLYIALLGVCVAGIFLLFTLRPVPLSSLHLQDSSIVVPNGHKPMIESIKETFRMLGRTEMLLVSGVMIYTGLAPSFFGGKYPAMVGGNDPDCTDLPSAFKPRFIAFSMMCVGGSEIIGGFSLGYISDRIGRIPVLLFGLVLQLCAYALVYVNMVSRPFEPQPWLALVCAFLLGLGDSAFQTQIYATLGSLFPSENEPAFALYKFFQSVAAAAAFFYSGHLAIVGQLGLLAGFAIVGTIGHVVVETRRSRGVYAYKQLSVGETDTTYGSVHSVHEVDA